MKSPHLLPKFLLFIGLTILSVNHSLQGQTKSDIIELQQNLNRLGYEIGNPDGIAGKLTKNAISEFQERINFSVTGEWSDRLLAVIKIYHINEFESPGSLALVIDPGSFNYEDWKSACETNNEIILILECESGGVTVTSNGLKCNENE